MSLQNTAISAFIDSKTTTNYTSYINRDVFIYRALLDPNTGVIIGEPFLIMRGMIAGGKLNEDPSRGSTMTWTLTSHWGNFVKVEGRRSVDSAHVDSLQLKNLDQLFNLQNMKKILDLFIQTDL